MAYNSTIKTKIKICVHCGKPCVWFSKKRCKDCARIEDNLNKEDQTGEDGLAALIDDCDTLFSQYIRLKYADKNGETKCYTCLVKKKWKQMQAGHYVSRRHLYLRFDERNVRPQCETCNCVKRGNLTVFARRLEEENEGVVEILLEESRIVYKPSRQELKNLISDLTVKIAQLK